MEFGWAGLWLCRAVAEEGRGSRAVSLGKEWKVNTFVGRWVTTEHVCRVSGRVGGGRGGVTRDCVGGRCSLGTGVRHPLSGNSVFVWDLGHSVT